MGGGGGDNITIGRYNSESSNLVSHLFFYIFGFLRIL